MPDASHPSLLIRVRDLRISFYVNGAELRAVDGVSFDLCRGRSLALVGESGCGKSVTALALLGLITPPGRVHGGSVQYEGKELVGATETELAALRGNRLGMVFQEPASALNPVMRIGDQVGEPLRIHRRLTRAAARERVLALLAEVGIPSPETRYAAYPHELSGGMQQRVMIAMALACEPALIIADEPTTALDVTIQAQILALLSRLQREHQMALLFITHDLGLLPLVADDVAVMYAGRIVEQAATHTLLTAARHPYTQALLESVPGRNTRGTRLRAIRGSVPDLTNLPRGCAFQGRCDRAQARCSQAPPPFADGIACFLPTGPES